MERRELPESELQKCGLSLSLKSSADANAAAIQSWGKNHQERAGRTILGAYTGLGRICVITSQKEKKLCDTLDTGQNMKEGIGSVMEKSSAKVKAVLLPPNKA